MSLFMFANKRNDSLCVKRNEWKLPTYLQVKLLFSKAHYLFVHTLPETNSQRP